MNLKIGLDSGACVSVLSKNIIRKLDLIEEPSDLEIKGVIGNTSKVLSMVKKVEINIQGYTCILDFVVLDHDSHDILLGIDWFKLSRAGLYPYLNLLRFPSGDVKLDNRKNETIEDNKVSLESISLVEVPYDSEELLDTIEWNSKPSEVVPGLSLTKKDEILFFDLLKENEGRFAHCNEDLDRCTVMPFTGRFETNIPVYTPAYRHSSLEEDIIDKEFESWLKAGIVVNSSSPWSSPVIVVPKKDGSHRVCIDYRRINKITIPDPFPIPNIDDLYSQLSGFNILSSLDLKGSYLQCTVDKKVREIFAITSKNFHVEPTVVMFGMKNAPMYFCKLMQKIFGDMRNILVYMDDIIVHTTTVDQHIKALAQIFLRLRKYKLKLNGKKCKWFQKSVKFLGFILDEGTIKADPDKVKVIKERIPPTNVKELQEFMGMINYYRKFIDKFAEISFPLTDLFKKNSKFEWNEERNTSFELFKKLLCSEPILVLPNFNIPFILDTDCSNRCIGVCLSQISNDDKEHPVYYASRTLKKAELNYTISEKECLAVVYGLLKFRTYILGREFVVRTDHSALKWLMTIQTPISRLCIWAIFVQSFSDFKILHREGTKHGNADTLSRPVAASIRVLNLTVNSFKEVYNNEALLFYIKNGYHVKDLSRNLMNDIERESEYYRIDNYGIWYRKELSDITFLLIPKIENRYKIIERCHLLGHYQVEATYGRIKSEYYWYNMVEDIKQYVKKCIVCQRNERGKIFNHPAKAIETKEIFKSIRLDYIHGLPVTDLGHNCILNIVDSVSSWFELYALDSKESKNSVKCLLEWCCRYGTPDEILTDRGTEFVNELMRNFCSQAGIEPRVTAAYNPRTNGKCERLNDTTIVSLRKHCENNVRDWDNWLPYIMMSYRSKIHKTTKFTPYEFVFGLKMKTFDYVKQLGEYKEEDQILRAVQLKNLTEKIRPYAVKNISEAQERQKKAQNDRVNVRSNELPVGTKVMMINDGIIPKLDSRYKGPFTIISKDNFDNYTIKDNLDNIVNQVYPLHKLKEIVLDDVKDDKNDVEIEKILDHKDVDSKRYYLVKWKGFKASENEWVIENDFSSKKIINKYLAKVKPKNKRGRASSNFLSSLNILTVLFFLLCTYIEAAPQKSVRGNFKFCTDAYNIPPINRNNLCKKALLKKEQAEKILEFQKQIFEWEKNEKSDLNKTAFISLDVYSKENFTVIGVGFECSLVYSHWTFGESWLGYRWKTVEDKLVKLSENDCFEIEKTKKCFGKTLKCIGNTCEIHEEVEETYSRWFNIKKKTMYCMVSQKTITAKNAETQLFGTNCVVNNFSCRLSRSIIVWKKNIIKSCPFRRVMKKVEFDLLNDAVRNDEHNIVFKYKAIEKHCGQVLIRSSEGLYLIKDEVGETFYKKSDLPANAETDFKKLFELTLAQMDYNRVIEDSDNVDNFDSQCHAIQAIVASMSLIHDKYFTVKNSRNNDIVLYTSYGGIYKPNCVEVNEIFVTKKIEKCFWEIEVSIELKGVNVTAYLGHDGIIRSSSKEIPCKTHLIRAFAIPGNNNFIVQKDKLQLVETNRNFLESVTLLNARLDTKFQHDDLLDQSYVLKNKLSEDKPEDYQFPYIQKYLSENTLHDNWSNELIIGSGMLLASIIITCLCSCCNGVITVLRFFNLVCIKPFKLGWSGITKLINDRSNNRRLANSSEQTVLTDLSTNTAVAGKPRAPQMSSDEEETDKILSDYA